MIFVFRFSAAEKAGPSVAPMGRRSIARRNSHAAFKFSQENANSGCPTARRAVRLWIILRNIRLGVMRHKLYARPTEARAFGGERVSKVSRRQVFFPVLRFSRSTRNRNGLDSLDTLDSVGGSRYPGQRAGSCPLVSCTF